MRHSYGLITRSQFYVSPVPGEGSAFSAAALPQALSGTERLVSHSMQTHTASRDVLYVTRIRPTRQMGQKGTAKQGSGRSGGMCTSLPGTIAPLRD